MILLKQKHDGLDFWRGLMNAIIMSTGLWAVIIAILFFILGEL